MEKRFGKAWQSSAVKPITIPYIGPQDLRYFILLVAANKTGHTMFFTSPRNSVEAHLSLLKAYKCDKIVLPAGPEYRRIMGKVLSARPMDIIEGPDEGWLFDGLDQQHYTWTYDYEESRLKPFVSLHTSGSTGIPKPIVCPLGWTAGVEMHIGLSPQEIAPMALECMRGKLILCIFPFFHAAGLGVTLLALLYGAAVTFPPPGFPSASIAADLVKVHNVNIGAFPPAVIVDIAADPSLANTFESLDNALFAGGPLPKDVGDKVTKKTTLINMYGTTEMAILPSAPLDHEDWQYMKFSELCGFEMRPYTDDSYELYVVKDPKLREYQPIFAMFPDVDEYCTKDLFLAHPTKPDLWIYNGRSDDIIVYSTGEKFNPSDVEDALNGHSTVRSALVCGAGRFQSSLVIEPVTYPTDESGRQHFINGLWPIIQRVNMDSPAHARVTRDMVILITEDRPFPRAGKGTVQRALAVRRYTPDLDALYASAETGGDSTAVHDTLTTNGINGHNGTHSADGSKELEGNAVESALLNAVHRLQGFEHISLDDRLFDHGMDSLGVVTLVRSLRPLSSKLGLDREITAKDVYSSGTIRRLVESLGATSATVEPSAQLMQKVYERYTKDLPVSARAVTSRPAQKTVLLTGSTGSLGSYLLDGLLADEGVASVVCLNRTDNAAERQLKSMQEKGLRTKLVTKLDKAPVKFLHGDMSKPYFGLDNAEYHNIAQVVTNVIHNAWQVDFNVSFEHLTSTHIHGVRQLVDFSVHSQYGASLLFVSSIGAVKGWKPSKDTTTVPEAIIDDWSAAGQDGYAQSKLVSERILATAAKVSDVSCTICRVGQVAGPITSKGMWSKQEWLPSLVASSKYLGYLPSSLGQADMVDWVPVDLMAAALLDFASVETPEAQAGSTVYHAVNTKKTTWARLLPCLQEKLKLPVVSLQEWGHLLAASSGADLQLNAGLKLFEFYKSLAVSAEEGSFMAEFDMTESVKASKTLAGVQAVGDEWMELWLRQWELIA